MKKIKILTTEEEIRKVEELTGETTGVIYQDKYITLVKDAVRFPNGTLGTYIRFVESDASRHGCVILPIIKDKKEIVLLNHYRHATQSYEIEAPRGFGTSGLTPQKNAVKELAEEMNVEIMDLELLGKVHPDSGLFEKEVYIFTAYVQLNENTAYSKDEKEVIDGYSVYSLSEIAEMTATCRLKDGFTLAAISMAMLKGIL